MIRGLLHAAAVRPVLSLTLLTLVLLFVRGPDQSFWAYDEGWYAQQARWILQNNDWITQHWWGTLQYDRGMGIQWLIAASYALFGYSETAARLPAMAAALGCTLLTYAIARECVDRRTAFLAAAILSATPIWMQAARLATQDVPLVLFELLGIWALLRAEREGGRRVAWALLAGATIGLGFMVKTFMIVPAAIAMAPYLIAGHRRHRHLANPGLYAGLLLGFAPFLVWMGLSVDAYGREPFDTLVGKLFILSGADFHRAGPLYYLWNVPANAFPWPLLAVAGFVLALRGGVESRRRWLWIGYPVLLFVELTLFRTRVWYYALQLLPFMAIGAAVALMWLARAYEDGRLRWPTVLSAVVAALGAILVALGMLLLTSFADIGLEPAWAFGLLGIAAGLAWLVPLATVIIDRRAGRRSPLLWMAGWLLGPWLAIFVAYATDLWGNYGHYIKKRLQHPEISVVLHAHPIDFVYAGSGDLADRILLTLYTPDPGDAYSNLQTVPEGAYAWVHGETLKAAGRAYDVVCRVHGWYLVRVGGN